MWGVIAALNAAAWNSTAFCDWYIAHVFPVWVGTYGRLTGLFPFSVGEWMLAAGLALVTAAVLLGIAWAAVRLCSVIQDCWKKKASTGGELLVRPADMPDLKGVSGVSSCSLPGRSWVSA